MSALEIYAALCVVSFLFCFVVGLAIGRSRAQTRYGHCSSAVKRGAVIEVAIAYLAICAIAIATSSTCILVYGAIQ